MGASFFQPVRLINFTPEQTAINPWELHGFMFPHFAIPDPLSCIVSYSLSGDVPKGISVDAAGTISGTIKHFGKQPSCQDNFPDEKRKLDGSNWKNDGRFKHILFDFEFKITAHWIEHITLPNGTVVPCVKPGTTDADCIIRVIKDHNIDHKIYREKYMGSGSEKVNDIDIPFSEGEEADPGPLQGI